MMKDERYRFLCGLAVLPLIGIAVLMFYGAVNASNVPISLIGGVACSICSAFATGACIYVILLGLNPTKMP